MTAAVDDAGAVEVLAASSWEKMQARCEAYEKALKEYAAAEFGVFIAPCPLADVRLLCASAALKRAEGRLQP